MPDGTQVYGGVRVIKLRADPSGQEECGRVLLTGGSDGVVHTWDLMPVLGARPVRKSDACIIACMHTCMLAYEHMGTKNPS